LQKKLSQDEDLQKENQSDEKNKKLPVVYQNSMISTIPLANNRNFRVVSARPKTTELTNVLECHRFANALQIPTARSLPGATMSLPTTKVLRLQYFLHPCFFAFTTCMLRYI
jgi:hypothetical protein